MLQRGVIKVVEYGRAAGEADFNWEDHLAVVL